MKSIINQTLFCIVLLVNIAFVHAQTYTPLPYFCGFENPEDTMGTYGWKFEKRAKTGHNFIIGNAVHRMGSKSMYVSADGVTPNYSLTTTGSTVVAYKSFYLAKGTYDIMFEYRLQGEEHEESDVMRVAFYKGNKPSATALGNFPQYALDNAFKDKYGKEVFKTSLWTQIEGQVTAQEEGYYYLVFLFKEDGDKNIYAPGPCIDNIQIDKAKTSTSCASKPTNILINNEATGIKLTWMGKASEYEIMYNRVSNLTDTSYTLVTGVTTTEYSIPYASIPEGVYNFRIRALCDSDTSMWIEKANHIVYDESKHCLNYMDFYGSGTVCEYGNFANAAHVNRIIDYGYESRRSIHTVHYMNDEYDRLTGYKLKTVPEGQIASVRLGNWTEGGHADSPMGGSPSGRITYTYTIPYDKTVLLLHYAAVLQYAEHHAPQDQTRIQVEILNGRGQQLECATADFNARDVSEGNTRGWQTYQPKEGEVLEHSCPIKWLDWSVLGLNLEPYKGQTVKIRLTLNACVADYHFAYGYFVLDCTEGEVGGMSCTEKADTLFVPEGFDYLWYLQGDAKKTPVSTERFFVPAEDDINSYAVDLIYPEDNGCYFTLYANVWPRVPKVAMDYMVKPENCVNYVELINKSKMVDLKMDKEGNVIDTLDVASTTASIKDYYFEIQSNKGTIFENGMTVSSDPSMRVVVPNEGDTFVVVMKGMFNTCEDIKEYTLKVPELKPSFSEVTHYVCNGSEVEFNGKKYTEPGVYIDSLKSVYGCDSILQLTLETLVADTIRMDTTICSAELPYTWFFGFNNFERLDSSGVYERSIPSSLGCDSLYYILNLEVLESLVLKFDEMPTVCADDEKLEISYSVLGGKLTGYSVICSEKAKKAGFKDIEVLDTIETIEAIELVMPEDVRPDKYAVDLILYNSDCGNVDTTLIFDVLYPSDVIAQRWNDVLALKNSEYNGGYEFVSYQWYLNGQVLDGFTGSQYYTGMDLDFNGEYQVLLTRADDGVSAFTCSFVPVEFSQSELNNSSALIFTSDVINIESPQSAKCYLYNMSGLLYSVFDLTEGGNVIEMPNEAGIYVMKFDYLDGYTEIHKIVVGNKNK